MRLNLRRQFSLFLRTQHLEEIQRKVNSFDGAKDDQEQGNVNESCEHSEFNAGISE
jgi:hypothetical protein